MTSNEESDEVLKEVALEPTRCILGTQEGCPGIGGYRESCAYHNLLDRSEHD